MTESIFNTEILLLEIEELFERIKDIPHEAKALVLEKMKIKLVETFKEFFVQDGETNQDTLIEISFSNSSENSLKTKNLEFSNEIVNYCDDSITIVNATEDFFPSLNSILVENQEGNTCSGRENIQRSDLFTNNSLTKKNSFRKARKKEDNSMVCDYCGKQFRRKHLLRNHMKRHKNKRNFQCDICSSGFNLKDDLVKHLKTHSREKNVTCSLCMKQLVNSVTLRNHMLVIHRKDEKFHCSKCDYFAHSKRTLKEHIRLKHDKLFKKYACVVCKSVFPSQVMLKIHFRSHTGEKPYQCELCSASFICSGRLTNHKNSVHGEKKFPCDICNKSFKSIHKLKRHSLIHTRIKPFTCPFCNNYASNTQGNLTKHVKTVHQMNDFSYLKYKKMTQGEIAEVQDEWLKNAESFTTEYLRSLSQKANKVLTVEELKEQYLRSKSNNKTVDKNNQEFSNITGVSIALDENALI